MALTLFLFVRVVASGLHPVAEPIHSANIDVDSGKGDLGCFMCHICVYHMGCSLPASKRTRCMYYILSTVNISHDTQNMFQGVLRDDERRQEKMRQRQQDFEESQRKRAIYERTQTVVSSEQT